MSTVVITVVVLIFGEISPKSLAKEAPESFAMAVTPVIRLCVSILKPVNWLFSQWKKLLGCLFKSSNHSVGGYGSAGDAVDIGSSNRQSFADELSGESFFLSLGSEAGSLSEVLITDGQ